MITPAQKSTLQKLHAEVTSIKFGKAYAITKTHVYLVAKCGKVRFTAKRGRKGECRVGH